MVEQVQLEGLLENLTLDTKDNETTVVNAQFQKELKRTGFKIFTPLSDHGYFSWKPQGSYVSLSSITETDEIIDNVNLDAKPPELVNVSSLRLPQAFKTLPPQEHSNRFPFGQYDIACLYVASQHRGVNLNEVDFAFGGSTLEMLARQDTSAPYMVTRVPSTKTIMVVKSKEYVQNFADFGFQFERFVTGLSFADRPDVEFVEHMHLMQVGPHRVLFRAETDALFDGEPVEVKASNPRFWGTKVMFQMISSGSPKLCHGVKERDMLTRVNLRRLSDISKEAHSCAVLEKNILDGMRALKAQMVNAKDREVFKVSFMEDSLRLQVVNLRSAVLLPPVHIVKELLM